MLSAFSHHGRKKKSGRNERNLWKITGGRSSYLGLITKKSSSPRRPWQTYQGCKREWRQWNRSYMMDKTQRMNRRPTQQRRNTDPIPLRPSLGKLRSIPYLSMTAASNRWDYFLHWVEHHLVVSWQGTGKGLAWVWLQNQINLFL